MDLNQNNKYFATLLNLNLRNMQFFETISFVRRITQGTDRENTLLENHER